MTILLNRFIWPSSHICLLVLLTPLLLLLLWVKASTAEPLFSRGVAIANACATCHGPDGRSQGAIPSINALSKESFLTAMHAFQSGERQGTVMSRIAKGLDEAELEAVATYFADLKKQ